MTKLGQTWQAGSNVDILGQSGSVIVNWDYSGSIGVNQAIWGQSGLIRVNQVKSGLFGGYIKDKQVQIGSIGGKWGPIGANQAIGANHFLHSPFCRAEGLCQHAAIQVRMGGG